MSSSWDRCNQRFLFGKFYARVKKLVRFEKFKNYFSFEQRSNFFTPALNFPKNVDYIDPKKRKKKKKLGHLITLGLSPKKLKFPGKSLDL